MSRRFGKAAVYDAFLKAVSAWAAAIGCLHIRQHFNYRFLYYRYHRESDGPPTNLQLRAIV